MTYRQHIERAGLSIECGTEAVPDDGHYYVIHRGETLARFRSLKAARAKYTEVLASLDLPPIERGEDERRRAVARATAHAVVDEMERETFAKSAAKRTRGKRTRTYG